MGILVCRPGGGVRMADETTGRSAEVECPFAWPCTPCTDCGRIAFACMKSRECLFISHGISRQMPCVPGVCEMRFSRCGRYLYQLSSEADTIHTRCLSNGELLYAAPAGVFPRCMKLHSSGRFILCAAGAVSEALLMSTPDLKTIHTFETRHPCFAADFCRNGLVVLCAAEGDDIRTSVCLIPYGSASIRHLTALPGPPGALCVCPDGVSALLSTRAGMSKIDLLTGACIWNCPEWALCMRLECRGNEALVSDTLDGSVWVINHFRPEERKLVDRYPDAQACFL